VILSFSLNLVISIIKPNIPYSVYGWKEFNLFLKTSSEEVWNVNMHLLPLTHYNVYSKYSSGTSELYLIAGILLE
jgi:hypothetical protein